MCLPFCMGADASESACMFFSVSLWASKHTNLVFVSVGLHVWYLPLEFRDLVQV